MESQSIQHLNDDEYMVIDMDTGTVLGTNLVLVRVPDDEGLMEEISASGSAAWDYAAEYGIPLKPGE